MRLEIEKMAIENFKGVRSLAIDFNKVGTTAIMGSNGTGKSTIPDAFCWVLFNRDSRGNAPGTNGFREKPLDADGHEIHNLDTTVQLFCVLDGAPFNLTRTQRENWVKKRGSTNPVFQGNTSTYWINDVELAYKDFKARISEIASDDLFRLIGTLAAFNAQDWKKRRTQLLALTGAEVDSALLARPEYHPLADECGKRNIQIDDLRKVLADQRKRTNNELQMIPVRIDEARKALPMFEPHEISDAEYILKDNAETLKRIDTYIAEARGNAAGAGTMSQIIALEQELMSLNRQANDEWTHGKAEYERAYNTAVEDLLRAKQQSATATVQRETQAARLKTVSTQRDALRTEFSSVRSEQFTWDSANDTCPTCGQPMPADKLADTRAAAQRRFEAEKAAKLDSIKQRGTELTTEVDNLTASIANLDAVIQNAETQAANAAARRDSATDVLSTYPTEPDYKSNPRIAELREKIAELQTIEKRSPDEKIAGLMEQKAELERQCAAKRAILARRDAGIETEKRIEELERQQREKGDELAGIEQLIALADSFIKDRCAALEESINAQFPTVRWQLFETQINGGIVDVCNCMIPCESGEVPYENANTAAQMNADIEVINVLSRHYDVYVPLFVDGAESVNVLAHTDSQLIALKVTTDPELRVQEVI